MWQNRNLFLSTFFGTGGIGSFIIAALTRSNIAWCLGVCATAYSIYCSYLTHKQKKVQAKIDKIMLENLEIENKNLRSQ